MNPFDKIKEQINEDLHHKLPKKWKKIGNVLIADFSQINTNNYKYLIAKCKKSKKYTMNGAKLMKAAGIEA